MHFANVVEIFALIATPVALGYSWLFYFKKMAKLENGWCKRVTLISLSLASLAILAWPIMRFSAPSADLSRGTGMEEQVIYSLWWTKTIVWICVVGFIMSFFSKPRLILPIAVAYIGVASFWIVTTIPW